MQWFKGAIFVSWAETSAWLIIEWEVVTIAPAAEHHQILTIQVINLINTVLLSHIIGPSVVTLEDFPRFLIMITRVLGWLATTTIWTEISQKVYTFWYNNRYFEGRDSFRTSKCKTFSSDYSNYRRSK